MTSASVLSFFAREKECIKVFSFDTSKDGVLVEKTEAPFPLPAPKASLWSPDGRALVLVDPAAGVEVLTLADDSKETIVHNLNGCPKTTQGFLWSPKASSLVTIAPGSKGSQEPNVHVWNMSSGGAGWVCQAAFCYPKLERDKKVLQWTNDESLCARLLPDGHIHILDGTLLSGAPLAELVFAHPVQTFEFAPLRSRSNVKARLAVFVPDTRDDLQRVVGPAEVTIWELVATGGSLQLQAQEKAKTEVTSGQVSELQWNSTGSALIAHCQTEVDESGQSYYGGSRLWFVSHDGEYKKDLTDAEDGAANGTSVQAIAWSPTRDEFILIHGFQPAQATLWSWDEKAKKVSVAKVLLEKAHRNTIRFNQFGSLVCLAGFGNLAGQVDFFGRPDDEKCDFVRVSSCQANCTVSAEWAPDGRHFLTSVLAPRMRVDNNASIWRALTGTKVGGTDFEELYETQWRPEPPDSLRFLDVSFEEIESASKELASKGTTEGGAPKKQAYRPPKARGEGASTVAAMMRGEVATPDADDRRARKARQQRTREEEQPTGNSRPEPPWGELDHRERKDSAVEPEPEQPVHPPVREPPAQRPPPPPEAVPAPRAAERRQQLQPEAPKPHAAVREVARQPVQQQQQQQQQPAPVREVGASGYPPANRPAPVQQSPHSRAVPTQAPVARPTPAQPTNKQPQSSQGIQSHGAKLPCPSTGWQYVDPKQNIQGPFTLLEMQQWNSMGYFRPDLPMRCDPSDKFVPFAELFPHPMIPFQSYPNRPRMGGLR
mmetsp:Transcript_115390/g.372848  ORF Transcript_115390/g.372848 Transcript_115390/m.372848 type:complete len:771 (+) Transcript_115390:155-2467(+)